MALKSASAGTQKIDLGDGDWIEVRSEISKREYKHLVAYFPNRQMTEKDKLTASEAVEFQSGLFAALVVAWSAEIPATVENYEGLESADAARIDEKLALHFQSLVPTKDEGKADTTSRGSRR